MYLFYGNKTSVQFQNFSPTVVHPGDLQTVSSHSASLPSGLPSWQPGNRSDPCLAPLLELGHGTYLDHHL